MCLTIAGDWQVCGGEERGLSAERIRRVCMSAGLGNRTGNSLQQYRDGIGERLQVRFPIFSIFTLLQFLCTDQARCGLSSLALVWDLQKPHEKRGGGGWTNSYQTWNSGGKMQTVNSFHGAADRDFKFVFRAMPPHTLCAFSRLASSRQLLLVYSMQWQYLVSRLKLHFPLWLVAIGSRFTFSQYININKAFLCLDHSCSSHCTIVTNSDN